MATSAFKSTTKRASIGGFEDSGRRSRSLSRFPRPEPDDYNKNVPRGKFVNTTRGSTTPFPEISLDDLAMEFFSSSSSSSSKVVERKGRSVARWANDTASSSSRRKGGRSVSRTRGEDDAQLASSSASRGKNVISSAHRRRSLSVTPCQISDSENVVQREGRSIARRGEIGRWENDTASSRRKVGRSVSRTPGGAVSSSFVSSRGQNAISSAAVGSHRRRSLSVARYQISDSESEIDHSRSSSNRANLKAPVSGNNQMTLATKATASSTRRLGRSLSHKDFSLLHDGYSSHSSILTDDEAKDNHIEKHGFEKIIRAVSAKKADHATNVAGNGGLYEAMRKELRYAVEEIRTELNQAMGRSNTSLTSGDLLQSETSKGLQDFSRVGDKYKPKLDQLEKRKQDLLSEMLLEEQRGQDFSKMVKDLPNSRTSAVVDKPSRARKRSGDRSRMSERLIEEAERYFEDFICNVEDTDISSFDGERSDGSSTLGGIVKGRYATTIRETETCKTPNGSTAHIGEMDGVILPWLQWETRHDGSASGRNKAKAQTHLTPKALRWESEKEMVSLHDSNGNSISSHGSWSSGVLTDKREVENECKLCYDVDEYLKLGNNEELFFEMYRQRNRISSGSLLLCTSVLY